MLRAVDTRRYPCAENRTWSDQEDQEERWWKDRAANSVDPTVTRSTMKADVGVAVVTKTISRRLAEANLESKRPFLALPLTLEHRQLCLQWCQARAMWNTIEWQKMAFSDESRFVWAQMMTVYSCGGVLVNDRIPPLTVVPHTAHTVGILV